MKNKYSIFSLIKNAFSNHENWQRAWRDPEPKKEYDAVIVGGGGHGLATAYYLAKKHNLRNKVVLTPGVDSLNLKDKEKVFASVKYYGNFTKDNNPWGEKDFGAFNFKKERYNWKIDYYDNTMSFHSPDKTDPDKTVRVLTIMKASEY